MKINGILIFTGGALAGAGGAYLYLKNVFDKIIEEDAEKIRSEYIKQIDDLKDEINQLEIEVKALEEEPVLVASAPAEEKKPKKTAKKKKTSDKVDYNAIIDNLNNGVYSSKGSEDMKKGPYAISDEDWYDDKMQNKETVTYFEEDGTVCDENEEIIPNGLDLIGEDNLEYKDEYEEGILYVRNEDTGSDYRVVIEPGTYSSFRGETDW